MRTATLALILSILSLAALANGPEVGQDVGAIFPIESPVVHLVAESVDVRHDWLEYRSGTADCVYYLANDSDSTRAIKMAFVSNRPFEYEGAYTRTYRDMEMRVDIDGRQVPVHLAALAPTMWAEFIKPVPDSLPMWAVTIVPRDTVRVRMRYRVAPSGGAEGHHGDTKLQYYCRPAALWSGPIDHATIRFQMLNLGDYLLRSIGHEGSGACLTVVPSGWRGSASTGTYEWRFEDWEPTEDISVEVKWR